MYNTTTATINNIVSKLKKVGVFIKEDSKVKVNPVIVLDFDKHINLFIQLEHEEDRQDSNDTERTYSEEDGSGSGSE
jgi:hypothetical protein